VGCVEREGGRGVIGDPPNKPQEQTGGCYRGSAAEPPRAFLERVSAVPRRTSCRLLLSVNPLGGPVVKLNKSPLTGFRFSPTVR